MAEPAAAARADRRVERAYREISSRLLARRVPFAVAVFLLVGLAANVIEVLYKPERLPVLVLVFGAQLLLCGILLATVRLAPSWSHVPTAIATALIALLIGVYHATVGSTTEECLNALLLYLAGVTVVLPFGGRLQACIGGAALLGYGVVLALGAPHALPLPHGLFTLIAAVVITTIGVELLDRHRFAAHRRALELHEANAAQREEQELSAAVLAVAGVLNATIHDPATLAAELSEQARTALGADWAVLLRRGDSDDVFQVAAVSGLPRGLSAALAAHVLDPAAEPVLYRRLERETDVGLGRRECQRLFPVPAIEPVLSSALVQTVRRGPRVIGLLACCFATRQGAFDPRHHRLLAGVAHQAAMALENARLMDEARGANRAKSEFVATVSHELRTPLNVILGYTDLILDGAFGAAPVDQRDILERVRQQSMQLLDMIQPMLDLSRLEARAVALATDTFSLGDLFVRLQASIPTNWCNPGVGLHWVLPANTELLLRTDRGKLEMVLRNLIHNALKYTEDGTVHVSAEVEAATRRIRFSVADTGPGIAAQDLPAIFDMFRQASQDLPRGGGVGLGLYIVKRLSELLGAEVSVQSTRGAGSRFTVSLPMEQPGTLQAHAASDNSRA